MKFQVNYIVGENVRSKNIIANDLEEATQIADEKWKNWIDIIILDKKNWRTAHE